MTAADIARRALPLLDLTSLEESDTDEKIRGLCARAVTPAGAVAAVCVYPRFVALSRAALAGTGVRVATVVNFPAGGTDVVAVEAETRDAVAAGADEIDVVLPHAAFTAGDAATAERMLRAVRAACDGRLLKVIHETGALPDVWAIRAAAELSVACGADFLKTSTGKRSPAATPEATRVLLEVSKAHGGRLGVKPAGGIRDTATAGAYLATADELLGAGWVSPARFRFGASGLLDALLADLGHGAGGGEAGRVLTPVLPQEIIRAKRDGRTLTADQIAAYVRGITDGTVTEGQIAAFSMAVFFRGMTLDERVALTIAMTRSGRVMDWRSANLGGPVLDKHSTGGVGDKVSLLLAPMVAACGGFVPMISGRGLGHTGGTLDKMEAIPGYAAKPDADTFVRVVRGAGCAIIGQTADLAPADGRIYAVRDVTATVESLDLITASILSKKLAAGLDALVLDVKFGTGAFMQAFDDALALADSLVGVANGAGLRTSALLTDMNRCLGTTAGNALEVRECLAILRGDAGDARLVDVTVALAAEMLVAGALAPDLGEATRRLRASLADGSAADRFARMVHGLGGPADLPDRPDAYLATAPVVRDVEPDRAGPITAVDVRALGLAVVALGGGRTRPTDPVDPAVGLSDVAGPGESVAPGGRPLARVHARTPAAADAAAAAIRAAVTVGGAPGSTCPLVARRVGPSW